MTWMLIGLGGALGSMARHALNQVIQRHNAVQTFPAGIFVINVLGSVSIGVLAGLLAAGRIRLSEDARLFAMVGVLGGFTTFSAFSLDTLTLMRTGHTAYAVFYVVGQVVLSLLGVWIGFKLAAA